MGVPKDRKKGKEKEEDDADEHGFEWLERLEGSGINYYRKPDSGGSWGIWASE